MNDIAFSVYKSCLLFQLYIYIYKSSNYSYEYKISWHLIGREKIYVESKKISCSYGARLIC